ARQPSKGETLARATREATVYPDLRLAGAGALVLVGTMIWADRVPLLDPGRIILGGLFVLYIPGSFLVAALSPYPASLDTLERVGLSTGLSVALVPLLAFLVNLLPWGIRPLPIVAAEGGTTLLLAAAALARWHSRPRGHVEKRRLASPWGSPA